VSQATDNFVTIVVALIVVLTTGTSSFASTQGLNQIPTPDMPPEGDLSLSFQAQGQKLGNPYQVQAEMGLTEWFEIAVFKGFNPNELALTTIVRSIPRSMSPTIARTKCWVSCRSLIRLTSGAAGNKTAQLFPETRLD